MDKQEKQKIVKILHRYEKDYNYSIADLINDLKDLLYGNK